jgi:CHAT domain-containing protein
MHGSFDPQSPLRSKLYFAGSHLDLRVDDPKALYAEDMAKFDALRDRDLIFAAACQTGIVASDKNNEGELIGILRPLTANRNKNIILSLWNVDDLATRDFVEAFYKSLFQSKDVRASFLKAQDAVRQKYKLPRYWAAFYLSQSD